MNNLYGTDEVAAMLGLHPTTVRIYSAAGGIFEKCGSKIGHSRVYLDADIAEMRTKLEAQPEPGRKPQGMADGNGSKVKAKPLNVEQRYALILKMDKSGKSLEEIQIKLGYSAVRCVKRALVRAKALHDRAEASA